MTTNPLSVATLVIYIVLLHPTLYVLRQHGWPGFLGWFYLQLFCVLRIIGAGLSINTPLNPSPLAGSAASSNKGTLIVNNVGLSPLLLATAGILHEARRARCDIGGSRKSRFEWMVVIQYHLLVSGALALIVAGVVMLDSASDEFDTAAALVKAGSAAVSLCWVLLVVWTGISLLPGLARGTGGIGAMALDYAAGTKLLYAVIFALPLIALRLAYGVTSLLLTVTGDPNSAFSTSLAVKIVLGTVPEMILVIVFIAAGIATRNIAGAFWKKGNVRKGVDGEMVEMSARA